MATEYKLSYTAKEIDTKLGKIDNLADKSEIPFKTSELINDSGFITGYTETDPTVPEWAKAATKPSYTASEVGALPADTEIPTALSDLTDDSTHRVVTDEEKATWNAKSEFSGNYNDLTNKPTIPSVEGLASEDYVDAKIAAIPTPDVSGQIGAHNVATDAHNDIRLLVNGLTTRLNTLADSDDTTLDQMSEIVAYIKNNASLIESITTSKVNVSDIINNLTTNVTNKPLSAAQGVALKTLINNLDSAKLDASALPTAINTALAQAKASGEFDGEDGYSPVRGTDYWTEADKNEIKAYVDDVMANGEW